MIINTLVQLKGEKEPQPHIALVIDDAITPSDLAAYRNALTTAAKFILTCEDGENFHEECFWLLQLSEFISSSLDMELERKGGRHG